jgi:cell division protein FtsL
MKKNPKKTSKKKKRANNTLRRHLKALLPFMPYIIPLIITAFIYMWLYTSMNIKAMPIAQLKKQKQELIKQNDSIRLQIEELQANERIESIARTKLGMTSPEGYSLVALDEPMRPPGIVHLEPHPVAQDLQANKGSEGLFGFLTIGSLNKGEKHTGALIETASEQVARQSG